MSANIDTQSSRATWVQDDELDAVLTLLGGAVAGLPDAQTGEPIGQWGVGGNCAASFANEVFALRDFCWCEGSAHPETDWDDDENARMPPSGGTSDTCPFNFEHFSSGIKGTWYKHLGRDNEFSREATPGEALAILRECLESMEKSRP